MQLLIMRHGKAGEFITSDAERELTDRGRKQAAKVAELIKKQQPEIIDLVISSPYKRAYQTASIVKEIVGYEPEIITEEGLTPSSAPELAVEKLNLHLKNNSSANTMLITSHLPFVDSLTSLLVSGNEESYNNFRYSTGELYWLEGELCSGGMKVKHNIKPHL